MATSARASAGFTFIGEKPKHLDAGVDCSSSFAGVLGDRKTSGDFILTSVEQLVGDENSRDFRLEAPLPDVGIDTCLFV